MGLVEAMAKTNHAQEARVDEFHAHEITAESAETMSLYMDGRAEGPSEETPTAKRTLSHFSSKSQSSRM
jgi:hypothetical protein